MQGFLAPKAAGRAEGIIVYKSVDVNSVEPSWGGGGAHRQIVVTLTHCITAIVYWHCFTTATAASPAGGALIGTRIEQ